MDKSFGMKHFLGHIIAGAGLQVAETIYPVISQTTQTDQRCWVFLDKFSGRTNGFTHFSEELARELTSKNTIVALEHRETSVCASLHAYTNRDLTQSAQKA